MNNRVLVDTNIILDAAMSERPGWPEATLLLDEIAYGATTGLIVATSLKDIYYVLTKYAGEPAARSFISSALDAFETVPVDELVCRSAAKSNEPDFEDGIVRACAENAHADFIISRNAAAFRRSKIKRVTAREYLDLFCEVETVRF